MWKTTLVSKIKILKITKNYVNSIPKIYKNLSNITPENLSNTTQ